MDYKPNKELVDAMLKEYKHLDRLMAETLVSHYDHGTLDTLKFGKPEEPKHTEIVAIKTELN